MSKIVSKKLSKKDVLLSGIVKENPVFKLVLGMCPTLAVTTSAINGIGMGLAVTFVLVCSNAIISLLRNIIPDKVRIPAYITIIATFVTTVDMVMKKFIPSLYESLGLFIPLIVVNCVILARAESFASKNGVCISAIDGLGMGLGFALSLTTLGIIRELLGAGSFFGMKIGFLQDFSMTVFILPAGGFLTLGLLMAGLNAFTAKRAKIKKKKAQTQKTIEENIVTESLENQKTAEKTLEKSTEKVGEVKNEPVAKTDNTIETSEKISSEKAVETNDKMNNEKEKSIEKNEKINNEKDKSIDNDKEVK